MKGGLCLTHGKLVQLEHQGSHHVTTVVTSANASPGSLSEASMLIFSSPDLKLRQPDPTLTFLESNSPELALASDSSPIGGATRRSAEGRQWSQFNAPVTVAVFTLELA